MKHLTLPVFLIIIVGLLSPMTQANSLNHTLNILIAQTDSQNLESAVRSIKQKTDGRILSAETVEQNGQPVHKIKVLLPSGKVRIFKINAQ